MTVYFRRNLTESATQSSPADAIFKAINDNEDAPFFYNILAGVYEPAYIADNIATILEEDGSHICYNIGYTNLFLDTQSDFDTNFKSFLVFLTQEQNYQKSLAEDAGEPAKLHVHFFKGDLQLAYLISIGQSEIEVIPFVNKVSQETIDLINQPNALEAIVNNIQPFTN